MTLEVRVNGRSVDTYHKDDKTYIEGRKGSKYTLFYRNNTSIRKKVVLSVDGLNVTTGDSTWESGYVVDPWQSVEVTGFLVNNQQSAAFEFSSIKASYNQKNDSGKRKNVGVIGCLVFDEKVEQSQTKIIKEKEYIPYPVYPYQPWRPHYPWITYTNNLDGNWNDNSSYIPNASIMNCSVGQTWAENSLQGSSSSLRASSVASVDHDKGRIGTKWGELQEFKTQTVYYKFKSSPSEKIEIYYYDKKGLELRGITKPKVKTRKDQEAFPGFNSGGCPFPKTVVRRKN